MFKKILVPLDGSELAESVLPKVKALAQCTGAEIALLRVAVAPVNASISMEPLVALDIDRDAEAEAMAYLGGVETQLRAEGFRASKWMGRGAIAETILEFARNADADMIAMCTHGRGGLARLVIGSIADEVVRHAAVPVLLVRPAGRKNR